jgi:Na+(H+)/acetate symporter ActP
MHRFLIVKDIANYFFKKIPINSSHAYLLWFISLLVGFIAGLASTLIIFSPVFLISLLVIILFGENPPHLAHTIVSALVHSFSVVIISFLPFTLPILLRKWMTLQRMWYGLFTLLILAVTLVSLFKMDLMPDNNISRWMKITYITTSLIFCVLVFLNFLSQNTNRLKDLKISPN